jgi:hypothetical protein
LRLSAKESYQKAEVEIKALTEVKLSHRTQQKLVIEQDWEVPQAKQAICDYEVSMDSVKVSLRGKPQAGC